MLLVGRRSFSRTLGRLAVGGGSLGMALSGLIRFGPPYEFVLAHPALEP